MLSKNYVVFIRFIAYLAPRLRLLIARRIAMLVGYRKPHQIGPEDMTAPQAKITTFLMFEGAAEEAMTFYMSLFDRSKVVNIDRYGPGEPGKEGSVRHAIFELGGQPFMCIDSPVSHGFTFTPAISLYVSCADEPEIDRLAAALADRGQVLMPLAAYPFSKKFTWLQDRFGVSWQLSLR